MRPMNSDNAATGISVQKIRECSLFACEANTDFIHSTA